MAGNGRVSCSFFIGRNGRSRFDRVTTSGRQHLVVFTRTHSHTHFFETVAVLHFFVSHNSDDASCTIIFLILWLWLVVCTLQHNFVGMPSLRVTTMCCLPLYCANSSSEFWSSGEVWNLTREIWRVTFSSTFLIPIQIEINSDLSENPSRVKRNGKKIERNWNFIYFSFFPKNFPVIFPEDVSFFLEFGLISTWIGIEIRLQI